jgi:hypothetical protein
VVRDFDHFQVRRGEIIKIDDKGQQHSLALQGEG